MAHVQQNLKTAERRQSCVWNWRGPPLTYPHASVSPGLPCRLGAFPDQQFHGEPYVPAGRGGPFKEEPQLFHRVVEPGNPPHHGGRRYGFLKKADALKGVKVGQEKQGRSFFQAGEEQGSCIYFFSYFFMR
jgi:hypothetical protein